MSSNTPPLRDDVVGPDGQFSPAWKRWINSVARGGSASLGDTWRSVIDYGAVGDGVTDDTIPIQNAIDDAELDAQTSGGGVVFFPVAQKFFKTTVPLTVHSNGITLFGMGSGSQVANLSAGDCITVGDDVNFYSDVHITGLNIQAMAAGSACVHARKAPNTRIDKCIFVNAGGATGWGIRMTESFCSTITNNTFGSIMGFGIQASVSANGMFIAGNRLDGGGIAAVCGIYIDGVGNSVIGNVIETWDVCVWGQGLKGSQFHNYMEVYRIGYRMDSSSNEGIVIGGNFNSLSSECSVDISAGIGYTVNNAQFIGAHSAGAPVRLTTGPGDVFIGPNIIHDDPAMVNWPINHLALRQHLVGESTYAPVDAWGVSSVTHTGTTTETTLKTYTGTRQHWGTGTQIHIRAAGEVAGTNGTKSIKLKISGTEIGVVAQDAGATDDWIIDARIDVVDATVCTGTVVAYQAAALESAGVVSGIGIDLANADPTVTLTATLANGADSVSVTQWKIQLTN